MTPDEINKAIAEHVGWQRYADAADGGECWYKTHNGYRKNVPNYVGDLNAMHEAEQTVVDWVFYRIQLSKVVGIGYAPDLDICDDIKSFVSAKAHQRAEAFLRTIGKWRDA